MTNSLFVKATAQLKSELPFVLYRKPMAQELSGIFQQDQQLHRVNDYTESGFVMAPFLGDETAVLIPGHASLQTPYEVSAEDFAFFESQEDDTVAEGYQGLVEQAIAEIMNSDLDKVVLSRKISVSNTLDPMVLFQRVLAQYPRAFCYLWYHPKVGMWLGASPELFLSATHNRFKTMALAGTQIDTGNGTPQWTDKEIQEQQIVTDYIKGVLDQRTEQLQTVGPKTIAAGNLFHLHTEISGTFPQGGVRDLIEGLHPTPATCGQPLALAQQFIAAHEGYSRDFYTGFLGELNLSVSTQRGRNRNMEHQAFKTIRKQTDFYVNLRCMQLEGAMAHIYVGGGITAQSSPQAEWQETVSKSKVMLRLLQS